jgi:hypothetical protein
LYRIIDHKKNKLSSHNRILAGVVGVGGENYWLRGKVHFQDTSKSKRNDLNVAIAGMLVAGIAFAAGNGNVKIKLWRRLSIDSQFGFWVREGG